MVPPGGSGPWDPLGVYLRGLGAALGARPGAVLVISGHWEAERPTVNTAAAPPLLFDYYNFPEHTYRLRYPAPGAPALAARVRTLLGAAGIATEEDAARGYDHGVFIPFMLIYPEADVPILQLSLQRDLDPGFHIALGRALEPLRGEGVLIAGSGLSYHNLRALPLASPQATAEAEQFDAWLTEAVEQPDAAERNRRLAAWESAPAARACHPEAEHLLPLMVAAGAAGEDRGRRVFAARIFDKPYSGFQFG